jgi:hypothetical protein
MKKSTLTLLSVVTLLALGCSTYVPTIGMPEKKFISHSVTYDLVYAEGNVKAYRSGGSYYYFKDGLLVKVIPELITADKV